jgi:DNA-binding transcriptional MerR regulator
MKRAAAASDYPKKLYYRINEVGKITGVKPYVLRYWETEFKQLQPEKDAKSQRRYRQEDIALVLKIKNLLYERRFTIAGAREQLRLEAKGVKASGVSAADPKADAANKRKILKDIAEIKKELSKICDSLD